MTAAGGARPVAMFEAVTRPSDLDAPTAGLVPALGSRPLPEGNAGGAWLPDLLGTYQVVDPCDPDPPAFPYDAQSRPRLVLVSPVTLRTNYWWQGRPMDFDEDAAERYAVAVTSAAVTRELWLGEATQDHPVGVPQAYGGGEHTNDYLANPATCSVAAGAALPPSEAIAVLDGLGQRALRGATTPVIHVTPEVAQSAAEKLTSRGSTLRTINGSVVVADAGAPGTGPGGRTGLWGYVTGPVGIWLGSVDSNPARPDTVRAELNRREVWASRTVMVGFSPDCHIAVPIDLPLPSLTTPTED